MRLYLSLLLLLLAPNIFAIQANFTTSPPSGDAPLWVTVDAVSSIPSSTAIFKNYQWEISDGRKLLDRPHQRVYFSTPGDYVITLTVIDTQGDSDSTSRTVHVNSPGDGPNGQTTSLPIAYFTVSPVSGSVPLSVTFDAINSLPSEGATYIKNYQWDVRGINSLTTIPVEATSRPTVTFVQADNYIVTLRVTDNLNRTSNVESNPNSQANINVLPSSPTNNSPPTANFSHELIPDTRTIQLNAFASSATDGKNIQKYKWQVTGDSQFIKETNGQITNTTSDEDGNTTYHIETDSQLTDITFDKDGTYHISLVVVDSMGIESPSTSDQITFDTPSPPPVIDETPITAEFSIEWITPFKARLISNVDAPQGVGRYQWLGDIEIDADTSVVDVEFPQADIYSITLVVFDNAGNRAENTHVIDIVGYPDLGKGWTFPPISDDGTSNNLSTFFRGGVMDLETGKFLTTVNEIPTIKQGKEVNIIAEAMIDTAHQNQQADTLVVVGYQAEGQEEPVFYVKTENTFIFPIFEQLVGDFTSIKAARSDTRLLSTLEIPVYKGKLPYVSGNYMVFIGYRLREDNTVVYNGNHIIQFQVVP
jgi:PKD repeat protein